MHLHSIPPHKVQKSPPLNVQSYRLTDRLTQIEWDEGFDLADLLYELALLEEHALGEVKHGQWREG